MSCGAGNTAMERLRILMPKVDDMAERLKVAEKKIAAQDMKLARLAKHRQD